MNNILCTRNCLVWLLLAVFNLVVSSFAYAQVVVPEGNVAFVIVSEDNVTPTLTEREEAVVYKLGVLGYTDITYISPAKLADVDFSKARFVIATEENTLDAKTVNSLLESGKGLVLLYNSAYSLGGHWVGVADWAWGIDEASFYIEEDAAFLKGYAADLSFQVQSTDGDYAALYIEGNYPTGWKLLGRNASTTWDGRTPDKTAFYREHASGGKGVIFTYNPQAYTEIGENVFEKIIEWVAEPPIVKGVTVPEGNVAFVTPWMTDIGLRLTSQEMSVQERLKAMDYNKITYIPLGKLNASDLSKATLVVAVEYPSLDVNTIDTLIENGQSVVLFYYAGAPLSPRGIWTSGGQHLYVEKGEKFLEGYASDVSLHVGGGIYLDDRYPLDWTALGRTTSEAISKKTAFYREHASGGRGVIFTYNPESLTWRGESIFNAVIQWATKSLTITPMEVPEGDVAFIVTSYDEVVLTDMETIVSDKLKFLGYKITHICFNRVAVSDFSKSRFVIATEQKTLDAKTVNSLLESGKGLVLLYNSAYSLGGHWVGVADWAWGIDEASFYIEEDAAFLKGYAADLSFQVQSTDGDYAALYIEGNYPTGWKLLGRNASTTWDGRTPDKTAFYREHASGGKGVIFTYNPQAYTEIGENVFEKIIEWVAKPPIVKGVTVPEGNVAFVTPWITDIGLRLTSREVSVQDKLKAMDYKITYVPISRLKVSDLSKAKFIIGVEYPSLDAETINFLLETGKGVVLLYDAAGPLAREWESSSSENGYKILVSKGEAFLEGYDVDASFDVQSSGYAGYIPKGYPLGWTIVGKNTADIAYMTTFYQQHTSGGRGTIFTYDVEYYTDKGGEIFEKIIEWVSQALPDRVPAIPVLSSPTDGSIIGMDTPTLKWLPVGSATSYTVRIATDSEFTDLVIEQSGITTNLYTVPSGKLKDKIYYWKVNASNSAGTGAWSNTWVFSKVSGIPVVGVSTFTLSLDSGLNMLSLPVKPETPFTARSFAERLGATLVIRYDTQGDEFIPFVPEAFGGDGFGIEGGQGYIVNLLESKEVAFTGSVWTQAPAKRLSTVSSNDNSTWAFVVCGAITSSQTPDALIISVENVRTGASSKAVVGQLESDRYAAAFVNLSRKGVIKSGDVLDITLRDVADRIVSGPIRYAVTPSDIMTGYAKVNMRIGDIIPDRTALLQNYPNPFNPETWIPYQLAQKENVTISIYNISGQLVRILNLGRREAGLYLSRGQAAYWDGQSDIGEQTASGVYFYTIEAGGFRATRRLVVIR